MAKRILLISTNRCSTPDPVFPLGLAYLSAALHAHGHKTEWIDCQIDFQNQDAVIKDFRPDLVGISVRNVDDVDINKREIFYRDIASLCRTIRLCYSGPIVLGGSGFSIFPQQLLKLSEADFGICGEGESSLVSLIAALDNQGDFSSIPGLAFYRDGCFTLNPQQIPNSYPQFRPTECPTRLINFYLQQSGTLNVQTQRGCPFSCCYCTYPLIEGHQNRRRSPEAVADEMEIIEKLGARFAVVVDSVFNSSASHVAETCEAVIKRNLKINWGCFLRPQGLTDELMELMKRAGLSHIEFGSDSFCDEVLNSYHKCLSFDEIHQSSDLAHRHKIDYCHFLICGGPGETEHTLKTSFKRSQLLNGAVIMGMIGMRIYPGTRLFKLAVDEGMVKSDIELLEPVFYVSKYLTPEQIKAQIVEFARLSPNWIVGEQSLAFTNLVNRLRKRGVVGPLWGYFSMIQRLWPQLPALPTQ